MAESVIRQKSFAFALATISVYKRLVDEREFVLSRQLLRSGTSIGANVEEASAAQSREDFHAKMAIASKEARETVYWLRLLQQSKLTCTDLSHELALAEELVRILTAIVKTTEKAPRAQGSAGRGTHTSTLKPESSPCGLEDYEL